MDLTVDREGIASAAGMVLNAPTNVTVERSGATRIRSPLSTCSTGPRWLDGRTMSSRRRRQEIGGRVDADGAPPALRVRGAPLLGGAWTKGRRGRHEVSCPDRAFRLGRRGGDCARRRTGESFGDLVGAAAARHARGASPREGPSRRRAGDLGRRCHCASEAWLGQPRPRGTQGAPWGALLDRSRRRPARRAGPEGGRQGRRRRR